MKTTLLFLMMLSASNVWANPRTFRVESLKVVVLPTKETGACWDPCDAQSRDRLQQMSAQLNEAAARDFMEVGTQEAERKMGSLALALESLTKLNALAQDVFSKLTSSTQFPEIVATLRLADGGKRSYQTFQRDRLSVDFSREEFLLALPSDPKERFIKVDVFDKDFLEDDQIGYMKIMVGDRVFKDGGIVAVRFDRVHLLQLTLIPVDGEAHPQQTRAECQRASSANPTACDCFPKDWFYPGYVDNRAWCK